MNDPRNTVARMGNVAVTLDHAAGYTIRVLERMPNYGGSLTYAWYEYCDGLSYADAIKSAAICAIVNHKRGGMPESGYED